MSFLRCGTPVTIVGVWQEPTWLASGGLTTGGAALPGRAD
jgi:hypothetical protein